MVVAESISFLFYSHHYKISFKIISLYNGRFLHALIAKNSIQRAFMACRMPSNDDSMRFSGQGSSMMRVFAYFDGDLEAQDLGGLAEVLFVDDADNLAGDVAGRRAVLFLAVFLQLI